MEYIIQLLILFILLSALLKLSFWKLWQTAVFALFLAAFVIVAQRWAVLQSKTQLTDFLNNVKIMQDTAVLITIESALGFAFCFAELRVMFGLKKARWWQALLRCYPGLLALPVLFYLQTQLIFAMPGSDFTLLTSLFATALFLGFPLLSLCLAWLCPEKELRLEIYFLVNLFVCIIGLITTVSGETTYTAARNPLNVKAVLLSLGLLCTFFAVGVLFNKLKWKMKWK
ncbi:MAG: hypothetical protein LBS52_10455 [Dysgonamonadaceae bacterium]|jgi:hypothetical protein|nr:hypothetical protein [Dysgonamonadaceae bacterium]